MKAVVCKQYGPPESLTFEELPSPHAGPGEAVVSVKAASVNFPDVLIIQNKYQFKPPLPFSPGSELAGVVKEVGAGAEGFKPGDRVIAFTTYGAAMVGVFWGDFARREPRRFAESVRQLASWYREGKLRPHVSQTFPLRQAAEALKLMAARQVKGKVVLTNE